MKWGWKFYQWIAITELESWNKFFFSLATTQESSSPGGGNVGFVLHIFFVFIKI